MEDIKILEQQILDSPEQIRKFVMEKKWVPIVEDISKKNNFSLEQKAALENETIFVLVGLDLLDNLEKNLLESLGIELVLVKVIVAELNERIFFEIKSFLPTEIEEVLPQTEQQKSTSNSISDFQSLPSVKTTELEVLPQMSVVPEGKVMDHLPPITPTQPKVTASGGTPQNAVAPTPETIVPFKPIITGYDKGKDPYREPIE